MSAQLIQQQPQIVAEDDSTPPMPPTDLIYDDGEPLESNRHRIAMNVLIEGVHQAYQERDDYFAGGNMFVYYSSEQVRNRDFKGPDFFVTLDVDGKTERRSWIVWEEMGRYPDVILELMSPSTASQDIGEKKILYEGTFRTQDYFVYNPFERKSLQGWHLGGNLKYKAIAPDERGWLWCETLGLWLGVWEGTILRETATWVRFYDSEGNLILLGEEKAEEEHQRAEEERQRAEEERQRAEEERQRAEEERQRAEEERQRANRAEVARAEAIAVLEEERRQKQMMRNRLLEMGVDPDSL